jgi:hypothetical protein
MTTTTSPQNNIMNSSSDYRSLMNDIKTTIDKNDNLFKIIQKTNYPDSGAYSSELLNYKIDTQITDLQKAREDIWNFLRKTFEENTKLRTYYFTEIRKADMHIKDLQEQKQEIINNIDANNTKTSTSIKSIKNEKYMYSKMEYYLFLYKILVFVQIAILAVITLCITGIIPRATCLIITIIILISTVAFVGYYVFFVNIGRSTVSWSKYEFDNNAVAKSGQCVDSTGISDDDKAKAATDEQVKAIIDANKSNKTCST